MMNKVNMKLFTRDMIDNLILQAAMNKRLRLNHNVHETPDDNIQKLFIAARLTSYFRPHRHPGKKEFAIVLRGLFDVILFDDHGLITQKVSVGTETDVFSLEIPPDVLHTWVPLTDQSVFFEVKQGPYDPATAVQFAYWSPEEGSVEVNSFRSRLLNAKIGELVI
ncbi:MAG: WbuC family cupin fold metalloprotein [Syntrophales bacterium]